MTEFKVFAENLLQLVDTLPTKSVAEICRDLDINRQQFSRYQAGEAIPRAETLYRITRYFSTDARILTDPLESLSKDTQRDQKDLLVETIGTPLAAATRNLKDMPLGFYTFWRELHPNKDKYDRTTIHLRQENGLTTYSGVGNLNPTLGKATPLEARCFSGLIHRYGDVFVAIATSNEHRFFSFTTLKFASYTSVPLFKGAGVATGDFSSPDVLRTRIRIVWERQDQDLHSVLANRRKAGLYRFDELPDNIATLMSADSRTP